MMLAYARDSLGYMTDEYLPIFKVGSTVSRIDFDSQHMQTFMALVNASPDHGRWLDFLEGMVNNDESQWGNAYLELMLDGGMAYVGL